MASYIDEARRLRPLVVEAAASLDDKTISTAPELLEPMQLDGGLIKAGTRVSWQGGVWRALADAWDRVDNDPAHAPQLWEQVLYKDGCRLIPETMITSNMFSKGERGWWKDQLYESLIDNNSWNPEAYPDGWKAVAV